MSERPTLFKDYESVPVTVIDAVVDDDSTVERLDGPKPKGRSSKKGARKGRRRTGPRVTPKKAPKKVKGTKYRPSDLKWLEAIACFKPIWEIALQFDALIDVPLDRTQPGTERSYKTFDVLLFEVATWRYGTYELTSDNFVDTDLWCQLRAAVEAAYPDDPRMRLSRKPMNRSKHYRFRDKYLHDHLFKVMRSIIDAAAVKAGMSMGMFTPDLGSLTNPDKRSFLAADGCWVPALSKLTRDDAVDPETGEIVFRRFCPDAMPFHTNDGEWASSPGHLFVMVQGRTGFRNERVIYTARHKSAKNTDMPRSDATIAVDAILDLAEKFPDLSAGLRGVVYDMALSVADFDRLLDAGLIPVSKVQLTKGNKYAKTGKVAVENLGQHTFRTTSRTSISLTVYAVHGTPCIISTDGDGIDYYLPLRLTQVKQERRKGRPETATKWVVPDSPLAPADLRGATTRVRHTRTTTERKAGKSRSRALRIFPESDRRFDNIFGLREDSESANSDLKSRLWNKRCRTLGHESVELNVISYQIHVLITALLAFHNRTGADLREWFGQHQLPRKRRHLALAA